MNERKLARIKLLHTVIWGIYVAIILYIFVVLVLNKIDLYLWLAIVAVIIEGLILIYNGWKCPLTNVAEKYTEKRDPGFDIYLPQWLAKHNKTIFSVIFFLEICMLIFRLVKS